MKTEYNIAEDILQKIYADFESPSSQKKVLLSLRKMNHLLSFEYGRISRCILFIAKGDERVFEKTVEMALIDWRDVIMEAEYNSTQQRMYDFNKEFSNARIT